MNNLLSKSADEKTTYLIDKLQVLIKETKFEGHVFLVGGAVRDMLLGKTPKDFDIAVDLPNGGINLATWLAAQDHSLFVGKNPVEFETYGTARVRLINDPICENIEIECVQTRKEKYDKSSRNPSVVFGTIEEDCMRRDLTINAIYYNISSEEILDVCGTSFNDLKNKLLRTPSDPNIVFDDDPLRMMRVIRFSTKLGWDISKETWFGILKNANRIKIITQERITDEFSKILLCDKPSIGLQKLRYCGLLELIAKDIYDEKYAYESKSKGVTVFDHTMETLDMVCPYIEHRLAALYHDVGRLLDSQSSNKNDFSAEIAKSDLTSMKYSSNVIKAVETAIKHHEYMSYYSDGMTPSDKRIRKLVNLCGKNLAITLDLMNANNNTKVLAKKPKQVELIINRLEELNKTEEINNVKLPVNGVTIMKELNLKGGPIIGRILDKIREEYFSNPKITKEECLEIAHKTLNEMII